MITGAITPASAPQVIKSLFGKAALKEIIKNRAGIFEEMIKDEHLTELANGKTPEIITQLNGALEQWKDG